MCGRNMCGLTVGSSSVPKLLRRDAEEMMEVAPAKGAPGEGPGNRGRVELLEASKKCGQCEGPMTGEVLL